jgi:hypothetical protein
MAAAGARARLRRSRPALAVTAIFAVIGIVGAAESAAGHNGEGGGIIFVAAYTYGAWAAGYVMALWRRHLPLADAIGETRDTMARVERLLTELPETQDSGESGPDASVIELRPRQK